MTPATVLVSTWHDGVFVSSGGSCRHELAGQSVQALASDGRGGALAIVDCHSLCRRDPNGKWSTITTHECALACSVAFDDTIFVGTDDAHILCIGGDGKLSRLKGFDTTPGRDTWYAGTAVINGQIVGPPLGVRSMCVTADGKAVLVNVHVGGISRSTNGGATWCPTIDIDSDVHEVCAHPDQPDVVIAAAAIGICISRDGGATWAVERQGLHGTYCSAVAFSGDDILVAASEDHFSGKGAVYRRPINAQVPFTPVGAGLPRWTDGIVDTGCIAVSNSALAIADKGGNLYISVDTERDWTHFPDRLPGPSSLLLISAGE